MNGNTVDEVTAARAHGGELRVIGDEPVEYLRKGTGGNRHLLGSNGRPRGREKVHMYPTGIQGLRV